MVDWRGRGVGWWKWTVALAVVASALPPHALGQSEAVSRETLRKAFQDLEKEAQSHTAELEKLLDELRDKFDSPADREAKKAVQECCKSSDPGIDAILALARKDAEIQSSAFAKPIVKKAMDLSKGFSDTPTKRPDFVRLALAEPGLSKAASGWFAAADEELGRCLEAQLRRKRETFESEVSKAYQEAKEKKPAAAIDVHEKIENLVAKAAEADPLAACVKKREQLIVEAAWSATGDIRGVVAASEDLARAEQARRILEEREKEYLQTIRSQGDGPLSVVYCDWGDPPPAANQPGTLACHNRALLVGGDSVSSIHVRGLPPAANVIISVSSGEVFPGGWTRDERGARWDLGSDRMSGTTTSGPGSRQINVYMDRLIQPKHRGSVFMIRNRKEAHSVLRREGRESLSIVTRGASRSIEVSVSVVEPSGGMTVKTADLLVVYKRWSFEAGGFFALTKSVDDEVQTKPVADRPEEVEVVSIDRVDKYRQESGGFLTFFPRNYPMVGLGLGFATGSGRPPSVFLGPAVRLLSFGDQAVLTLSAGWSVSSVRRFPGLEISETLRADSRRLSGRLEHDIKGYALVSLGFQFGPVPGPATR